MTATSFRFRSATPNLNVLVPASRNGVGFRDHIFETKDAGVAGQLREHAHCGDGKEFWEETPAAQEAIKEAAKKSEGDVDDDAKKKGKGDKK